MVAVAVFERLFARYVCECGTVYRVKTASTLIPSMDVAVCEHCGEVMDNWWASTRNRVYELEDRSIW
jgi:hypothetical protein